MSHNRQSARVRRHRRVRKKITGSQTRPRIAVFRSNQHTYAQAIDDSAGRTLAAASTAEAELRSASVKPVEAAERVGKLLGERLKAQGVDRAVFDRGGFRYHGRVAAVADGAREAGLEL